MTLGAINHPDSSTEEVRLEVTSKETPKSGFLKRNTGKILATIGATVIATLAFFITTNKIQKDQLRATYKQAHKDAGNLVFDSLNRAGFKPSILFIQSSAKPRITFMPSDGLSIKQIALLEEIYRRVHWEAFKAQGCNSYLSPIGYRQKITLASNFSQVVAQTFHMLCSQTILDQKTVLDAILTSALNALDLLKPLQQTQNTDMPNYEGIYHIFFNQVYYSLKNKGINKGLIENIAEKLTTNFNLSHIIKIYVPVVKDTNDRHRRLG